MNDTDILGDLTDEQREAVTHRNGPMLVLAGAGSGKTRVVTRRIAYLMNHGVWASQILGMTFTNKAAREMRERISALTGMDPPHNIGTFHGCCARFLRYDIEKLNNGRTRDFTIYDESESQTIIKNILKEHPGFADLGTPKRFSEIISLSKSMRCLASNAIAKQENFAHRGAIYDQVAELYEEGLRKSNAVDFDDLLGMVVTLLEQNKALRDVYRQRFPYLLIDEYQDTNRLQYNLMMLLTGPEHNVHVTGDPDQSIYSWRGADYSNIMSFTQDFPEAKIVRLERNYRSTEHILDAANTLIAHNENRLEKTLFTDKGAGAPITEVQTATADLEANYVALKIKKLHQVNGISYRNMAILYRTNSQSRLLEESLMNYGIPYQLLGGTRFYDRKEIKDLLSFLKLKANPCDSVAFERVVDCYHGGIGPKTIVTLSELAVLQGLSPFQLLASPDFASYYGKKLPQKLADFSKWCARLYAIQTDSVTPCVQEILDCSGLLDIYQKDAAAEDRINNLREFISKARTFESQQDGDVPPTLADFLQDVALVADVDALDPTVDRTILMTLHSSKGLEFPIVFITGVEDGFIPHANNLERVKDLDEERRLLYVGITRAKQKLYLLHANRRMVWNGNESRIPSRFLAELPRESFKQERQH